jgi:galactokinase
VALAVSREFFRARGIKAACRVHGGGFAGTIQAYVPVDCLGDYRAQMEALFGAGALTRLRIRQAGAFEFTKE